MLLDDLMINLFLQTTAATLVTAGSIYTETTIAVIIQLLVILALSIQIARVYFLRILRKFTLRLAADIWWLLFIILRDASIFLTVFLGITLFWPGTYQDFAIAVPFQPLAINFFAFALLIMLIKDTDEEPKYNTLMTVFILIGTILYIFGTVFVTESAVSLAVLPPTVSLSTNNFWGFINYYFNSMNNPTLSIYTFYFCFALFGLTGLIAVIYSFKNSKLARGSITTNPNPIIKQTGQAEK